MHLHVFEENPVCKSPPVHDTYLHVCVCMCMYLYKRHVSTVLYLVHSLEFTAEEVLSEDSPVRRGFQFTFNILILAWLGKGP